MPDALATDSPSRSTAVQALQIYSDGSPLAQALQQYLAAEAVSDPEKWNSACALVYVCPARGLRDDRPNLDHARLFFGRCLERRVGRIVVVSSTSTFGLAHHHPGLVDEERFSLVLSENKVARAWQLLEQSANEILGRTTKLTILRCCPVLTPGGADYFSRLFASPIAPVHAGYDPMLQFITARTLASVIEQVIHLSIEGTQNVAPAENISLRAALRLAQVRRLAIPTPIQQGARRGLAAIGRAWAADQTEFIRYHNTASGERLAAQIERILPSSSAAIREFQGVDNCTEQPDSSSAPDAFGMDQEYIAGYGRTLFRFMHDAYWRIEETGLENIPLTGRAIMAGIHRGFMPFDGVMTLYTAVKNRKRYPRFLIHPSLLKFPFLFNFMTKLGGIPACQENASRILSQDGIVAVFPEGIRGAFTLYKDAYKLGKFGRDEFVRIALRNRAPIIPFVTVGSAEIFPIFHRLDWGWCKRFTEWPYLPLTPTFPLLPLPLPTKWHTAYLEPVHVEQVYGPEAADDPRIVRAISQDIRRRMQSAIDDMRFRRRHLFFGSLESKP